MAQDGVLATTRRRLLGLLYLVVIAGLISLSIAFYNKAFTPVVLVTLKTDHTGNELVKDSDVKLRGIIVGSVRSVKVDNGDACVGAAPTATCVSVQLALQPSRVALIPSNVSAQILPKTLFGEQYVSLSLPAQSAPPIRAHDVIAQDRSQGALETETVLGDTLPLLQAVQPAELNATLTALASALNGRGAELGQDLVKLNQYLTQLDPHVPALVGDLAKLGQVAVEYNNAAPQIVDTIDNLEVSARTVIDRQAALATLLTTATNTSDVASSFLADNETHLISLAGNSDKIFSLLDEYSPEYSCLLAGVAQIADRAADSIHDDQFQLSATTVDQPPNLSQYSPGNQPKLITGLGPHCLGLPDDVAVDGNGTFHTPPPFSCINDGAPLTTSACAQAESVSGFDQQALGSPPETALIDAVIAGSYSGGAAPNAVPAVATMLAAPALRGAQVNVK
jgi:phospholipid/cholesterol/gamma-HCH transport system substrate-binding protein